MSFDGRAPTVAEDAFVAPGCRIVGDVAIGSESSVWYNCVLRGDINRIRIGARTNIQDGTIVHVDGPSSNGFPGRPTLIGDDVLIGHLAMIHGAILHNRAFIGMGATVLDSEVESDAMLAAGALLTPGKVVPTGQLWGGRPARYMRSLKPEEIAANGEGVRHYVVNGRAHIAALAAASD